MAQLQKPPSAFSVTGGGDRIIIEWSMDDMTGVTGFELFRAKGRYDSTYHLIADDLGPDDRSYNDTDLERGPSYYYYLSVLGEDIPSNADLNIPPSKMRSGRFYTQTFDPTNLKRQAVDYGDTTWTYMKDIRVVPNPYNISADPNNLLFPGERDKIAFFNIPGECDIQIFTELGELVTTIEHRNGTGDEYWNCTTDSKQIVVSGIYLAVIKDKKTGEVEIEKFVIIR
jgi:hypothetical protein